MRRAGSLFEGMCHSRVMQTTHGAHRLGCAVLGRGGRRRWCRAATASAAAVPSVAALPAQTQQCQSTASFVTVLESSENSSSLCLGSA